MTKLFINYAKEDAEFANRLYKDLQKNSDTRLWIDEDSLLVGDKWELKIEKAIREATFFIALLSRKSTGKSGHVQVEIREALKKMKRLPEGKRFILPIRLDDCTPSFNEVDKIQYVDMFPDWHDGLNKLLKVVTSSHGYLGRIARANLIVEEIEDTINRIKRSNQVIEIRMRATWTSMYYLHKKTGMPLLEHIV